jgi:ubiquinone/menaquinone biosynthesis C-methylase UbiE
MSADVAALERTAQGSNRAYITLTAVTRVLAAHAKLYRWRAPVYQTVMLQDLATLWRAHHPTLLDLGGGTGVMAEAIKTLLPVDHVTSVDVTDRFVRSLTVKTMVYDGRSLPFASGSFDAATINNVLHHVPATDRAGLMTELCRVVKGPIYIKHHIASSQLDHWRLKLLDAVGNIPFGGQVRAEYLPLEAWHSLAASVGRHLSVQSGSAYRSGVMAGLFPNRLEAVFRLDPQ